MAVRRLEGKRVLVTGASSGIGRAIALHCLSEGARVILQGRDVSKLQGVLRAADRDQTGIIAVDLADDEQIDQFLSVLKSDNDSLDVVVHSAAEFMEEAVEKTDIEDFDRLFAVNVRAVWRLVQGTMPMLKRSAGDIVFVNSSVIHQPGTGRSLYTMTKACQKALADSVRGEVNDAGIRVLSLMLGRTATPLQHGIAKKKGLSYVPDRLLQPEDIASIVIAAITLPRSAEVTDLFIRPAFSS